MNINQLILEEFKSKDFKKIHGHDKIKFDNIEAYFHNLATHDVKGSPNQTPGYQHCSRSGIYSYKIIHIGAKHGINNEFAMGHGSTRIQWFKFTKKIKPGWWDLSSGVKINHSDIKK